jgi:quercetin dioxygenase-like cupin family protein
MRWAPLVAFAGLAGCVAGEQQVSPLPAPSMREVLRGSIAAAPGHELVVGDLVLAPGAAVPRHFHPGEEFLYVLSGEVTIIRKGYADLAVRAGESLRIAPGVVHAGRAGASGARAVSSWVKPLDQPLRIPAPE